VLLNGSKNELHQRSIERKSRWNGKSAVPGKNRRGLLRHKDVRLPEWKSPLFGWLNELDDRLVQQLRIIQIGNVLLLHRRINIDLRQFLAQ